MTLQLIIEAAVFLVAIGLLYVVGCWFIGEDR